MIRFTSKTSVKLLSIAIIMLGMSTWILGQNTLNKPIGEANQLDHPESVAALVFDLGPPVTTNAIACAQTDGLGTRENNHFRRWVVPNGPGLDFTGVDIEVYPDFGGGPIIGAEIEANIYIDEADGFPGAAPTLIASSGLVPIASNAPHVLHFSMTSTASARPGDVIIIEIHNTDFNGGSHRLGYGTLSGDETWLQAAACGVPNPTLLSAVFGNIDLRLVLHAAVAPSVPTMGEWAIICLGMIMMIFGVVAVTQRQTAIA